MKTKQLLQYILITLLINFKTYGQELIKVEIIELDINKSTIPEVIAVDPKTGEIYISSIHNKWKKEQTIRISNVWFIIERRSCKY